MSHTDESLQSMKARSLIRDAEGLYPYQRHIINQIMREEKFLINPYRIGYLKLMMSADNSKQEYKKMLQRKQHYKIARKTPLIERVDSAGWMFVSLALLVGILYLIFS